jgi:transcription elongation factor Elf1
MTRFKWCCGGNHAVMVAPLWPVVKDGVKWYTALYKCDKCGQYTKRGETNQRQDWTTFVEWLNAKQVEELLIQKKHADELEESTKSEWTRLAHRIDPIFEIKRKE